MVLEKGCNVAALVKSARIAMVWLGRNGGGFCRIDILVGAAAGYGRAAESRLALPHAREWHILSSFRFTLMG